ncbi:MAG: hypothetical protein HQ472_06045 [Ignavibacteria bacterium]|nr:hypothetical protein [Ignavibacteria bacterium]
MINRIVSTLALSFCCFVTAFSGELYRVELDLINVVNDKIKVVIHTPPVAQSEVTFVFPVSVPGTYEIHYWYRLVHDFRAFDATGKPLSIDRSADSQFVISNATSMTRVEYTLDDSFDDVDDKVDIFPPAGTGFEADSVFVLNHGGIVGYIEGYQKLPFKLTVLKPTHLYGSTALKVSHINELTDEYFANTYDELVDSPVLYSIPDTATFQIAGVSVLVSLAHKTNLKLAPEYAKTLKKACNSIANFLVEMPVKNYAFLMYLWNRDTVNVKGAGAKFGALEHNYSSFYFWGYSRKPYGLADIAAHEFLHILVPLNVHSKEIHEFNFRKPAMSEHLWLYEGVTEYFAHLSSVHDSTSTEAGFLREMKNKTRSLSQIPKRFCFTDFSKNVLTDENQKLYPMVYTYGALNGLLLDITIRESSDGKLGLLDVVYQLKKKYGASKPFDDSDLFDDIEEIAGQSVREYCDTYLSGKKKIPMSIVNKIGWSFQDSLTTTGLSYGMKFSYNEGSDDTEPGLYVNPIHDNPLFVEPGDKLITVNGMSADNLGQSIWRNISKPVDANEITVVVLRRGAEVTLVGKPVTSEISEYNVLGEMSNPTNEQSALKRAVFYGK